MQIASSSNIRHILFGNFAEIDFPLPGSAVARNIGYTCSDATRDTANLDDPWFSWQGSV
jgi:hypothetical protein